MKKTLIIGLALGVVLTAGSAFAATYGDGNVGDIVNNRHGNTGGSGIVGSSHDLPGIVTYASTDGRDRICIFCHHPHHAATPADMGADYSPLWNRALPTVTFTAYSNGVMDNGDIPTAGVTDTRHWMNGVPSVSGVSLLCMSCHDGSTAMNAYSSNNTDVTGGSGSDYTPGAGGALSGKAALAGGTTDMTNHHPIGMIWADVVADDPEIAPVDTEWLGYLDNTSGDPMGFQISSVLTNGKMECVACHDVHNTANENDAERFLWVSNNGSKFCLTCHLK